MPSLHAARSVRPRPLFKGGEPLYDRRNLFLLDPDAPHKSAEELYRESGQMTDPNAVNHNCPLCHVTMTWPLFQAHITPCYRKWRSVSLDITKRKFAGATPGR